LSGEQALSKDPICIVDVQGERTLTQATRIHFGIQYPIQYNVKVKDLGYVHPEWMPALMRYWELEQSSETRQSAQITAEGENDEDGENQMEGRGYGAASNQSYQFGYK
jgi:hypothetical protein